MADATEILFPVVSSCGFQHYLVFLGIESWKKRKKKKLHITEGILVFSKCVHMTRRVTY